MPLALLPSRLVDAVWTSGKASPAPGGGDSRAPPLTPLAALALRYARCVGALLVAAVVLYSLSSDG